MQLLRPIRAACRAPLADAGFTLVETIVAAGLALLVLWPVSTVLLNTQQASSGTIQRADAIQTAQVGLRAMDQQLRNAYEIEFPTAANTSTTANSGSVTCGETTGVQPCNVVDVLTRTVNTSGMPTDEEVRFDCTTASTSVDYACWEYICGASHSTPPTSYCNSSNYSSKSLVLDQVANGRSTSTPVFSFCYPPSGGTGPSGTTGTSATDGSACVQNGDTRPSSVIVTIDMPAAGTLSTSTQNGDPTTLQLTDTVYMQELDSTYYS